jgi:hypothetical protein
VGIIIAALVLVIGCVVGAVLLGRVLGDEIAKQPSLAQVDDCLSGSTADANNLEVVDCGDTAATLQVVQRVEDVTQADFAGDEGCTHPDTTSAVWLGVTADAKGTVLCLKAA